MKSALTIRRPALIIQPASLEKPKWRNGRRAAFRAQSSYEGRGSSPRFGTQYRARLLIQRDSSFRIGFSHGQPTISARGSGSSARMKSNAESARTLLHVLLAEAGMAPAPGFCFPTVYVIIVFGALARASKTKATAGP